MHETEVEQGEGDTDFFLLVFSCFGVYLKQGFPNNLKFGRKSENLAVLFGVIAMILTTLYSSLVVAKLMTRTHPEQINSLDDLRARKDVKILLKQYSFMHYYFKHEPAVKDLFDRVELLETAFSRPTLSSVDKWYARILSENVVYIEGKDNFLIDLRALNKYSYHSFHFSTSTVFVQPAAWIFPTGNDVRDKDLKEAIIQSLLWIK